MKPINLSICISTYNFGKFIGETLDSIISQIGDQQEIIIVDGASTDNTEEIVADYQKKWENIHYHRSNQREGIDKAIVKSIDYAHGKYCWLFSADDLMIPGSVEKILREIASGLDVYLTNFSLYSLDLKTQILERYPMTQIQEDFVCDFNKNEERHFYFENAIETCAFFSFMSSLIINREKWLNSWCAEQFIGSCWAHVPRIFHMMSQSLRIKYLHQPFLIKRDGNDSFLENGYIHRIGISIYGFTSIGRFLFGENSFEMRCVKKTLRKEHSLPAFMNIKATAKKEEKIKLKDMIKVSREKFSLEWLYFILIPTFLWKMSRFFYRRLKRILT